MLNLKLLSSFPKGYTPNKALEYILSELAKAFETDHKFIVILAPTASGKSFISKTLSNYSEDPGEEYLRLLKSGKIFNISSLYDPQEDTPWGAAILTCTKSLLDLYGVSFPDGSIAKGRVNYVCSQDPALNCELGYCKIFGAQKDRCYNRGLCPYRNALIDALANKCAFYSYSMYGCLPPRVKYRQFLVCDEASELESEIVNEFTAEIGFKQLKRLIGEFTPTPLSIEDKNEWWKWLSTIYDMVDSVLIDCQLQARSYEVLKKAPPYALLSKIYLLDLMKQQLDVVLDAWDLTDYIISRLTDGIKFIPYNIDKLANSFFSHGDRVILMSATIVDPKRFAKTLGIDDFYYIEADCTLDPKKAPILCSKDCYLSYKTKWQVLPRMVNTIKKICEKYGNKKGLIHTHTMEILKYLREELKDNKRFIYREDGVANESLIRTHSSTDMASVMVSPSMTHGVDLKGDLGEFQIIVKAPYPPLGDPRVKRKFEEDKQWYINCMLSTLIQASGRCNRTVDDESVTFILDTNALDSVLNNKDLLPKYFKDRFI